MIVLEKSIKGFRYILLKFNSLIPFSLSKTVPNSVVQDALVVSGRVHHEIDESCYDLIDCIHLPAGISQHTHGSCQHLCWVQLLICNGFCGAGEHKAMLFARHGLKMPSEEDGQAFVFVSRSA